MRNIKKPSSNSLNMIFKPSSQIVMKRIDSGCFVCIQFELKPHRFPNPTYTFSLFPNPMILLVSAFLLPP